MAVMDSVATEQYGIPSLTLMENAGRAVADAVLDLVGPGDEVAIFCGRGNNGGDGLVAARILHNRGMVVRACLLGSFQDLKPDPRANLDEANRAGVTLEAVTSEERLQAMIPSLSRCSLVVDALLGTGFQPPVRGLMAAAIRSVNGLGRPVLAVDIPSGLSSDSGTVPDVSVTAATTVTFGLPKVGQFLYPAAGRCGRLMLADIGFPPLLVDRVPASCFVTTSAAARSMIAARRPDSHKGTYGHVLIVAGSCGMGGAAQLAARGALRGGAGLVTVAVPESMADSFLPSLPEAMTLPLPEVGRGILADSACDPILEKLPGKSVVAIGPGLSRHPDTERLVLGLVPRLELPAVIDADGLAAVASSPSVLLDARSDVILTPHPGELGRLMGRSAAEVQENRVGFAREFAKKYGVTLVLKGAHSLVATPSGAVHFNLSGNAGMAAGGMGDVLTGLIGALVAQGSAPREGALLGVHLHGLAGDRASVNLGPRGFLAGEVADLLPAVYRDMLSDEKTAEGDSGTVRLLLP